jgi:hypothetical protein
LKKVAGLMALVVVLGMAIAAPVMANLADPPPKDGSGFDWIGIILIPFL